MNEEVSEGRKWLEDMTAEEREVVAAGLFQRAMTNDEDREGFGGRTLIIMPTSSFIKGATMTGFQMVDGEPVAVGEKRYVTMLLTYDEDRDEAVIVYIPVGVGGELARDLAESDQELWMQQQHDEGAQGEEESA